MKKWAYGLLVLVLLYGNLWPFEPVDARELWVVEQLNIDIWQGKIRFWGENIQGTGETMKEAQKSMEEASEGTLFLRQVTKIVLWDEAGERLNLLELPEELPLGAVVYEGTEQAGKPRRLGTLAEVKNRLLEENA